MDEAHIGSCLRDGFKSKGYERAQMATDRAQWNPEGLEVAGIQRPFIAAPCDCHDAAESGSALEERQEVGDEAEARVEVQGGQQVEMLGCFYRWQSMRCSLHRTVSGEG